jgi:hypothetical protein
LPCDQSPALIPALVNKVWHEVDRLA